ncbi:hypothetical protein Bhyg_04634 [Pseudolycoriella hygida]|uniref:THAP-type domain-containing protein n=1 Tax=Pseudolycoriella hygida TaxID=35572 RepID=A0A9Q0SA69_9DIPT|nr:hypothetical protein Bhyg_04634 [Pseudolycoriella hygida]
MEIDDQMNNSEKHMDIRGEWLSLHELPNTANGRVCSKHFEQSDFVLKEDGRRWLKPIQAVHTFQDEVNEIEVPVYT